MKLQFDVLSQISCGELQVEPFIHCNHGDVYKPISSYNILQVYGDSFTERHKADVKQKYGLIALGEMPVEAGFVYAYNHLIYL